jgi:hypothetical protein
MTAESRNSGAGAASIVEQHFSKHILEIMQSTVETPLFSRVSEPLEVVIHIRSAWKLVQSRRFQSEYSDRFSIRHLSDRSRDAFRRS